MTKEEFIRNLMENDREGIDRMSVSQAADILDWMRGDDENHEIPDDLTAEELANEWNKNSLLKIQFEAGEGRYISGGVNFLICLDCPDLYAEIPVPEGASDDYGYMSLKEKILHQADAADIDRSRLSFWYDGQENYLSADAWSGMDEALPRD